MGRGKLGSLVNMLSIITKRLRVRYARSSSNLSFVILTNNLLGNNLPYCPMPQNIVQIHNLLLDIPPVSRGLVAGCGEVGDVGLDFFSKD
jgi:hypothetical protein